MIYAPDDDLQPDTVRIAVCYDGRLALSLPFEGKVVTAKMTMEQAQEFLKHFLFGIEAAKEIAEYGPWIYDIQGTA